MFKYKIHKLHLRYHITYHIMKKSNLPQTKTYKPIPASGSVDWVIWAAWADRVTFEDIYKETGLHEKDVIKLMRKNLKKSVRASFNNLFLKLTNCFIRIKVIT